MVCAVVTYSLAILFIDKFNYITINLDSLVNYSWIIDVKLNYPTSDFKCNSCTPAFDTLYVDPNSHNIYKLKIPNFYYTYITPTYPIKIIIVNNFLI